MKRNHIFAKGIDLSVEEIALSYWKEEGFLIQKEDLISDIESGSNNWTGFVYNDWDTNMPDWSNPFMDMSCAFPVL